MSFDQSKVSATSVFPQQIDEDEATTTQRQFKDFILEFRDRHFFIYRDQLRNNVLVKEYCLRVDLQDLASYNEILVDKLTHDPSNIIPLFEFAVQDVAKKIIYLNSTNSNPNSNDNQNQNQNLTQNQTQTQTQDNPFSNNDYNLNSDPTNILSKNFNLPNFQIILKSNANPISLRDLSQNATYISKLVRINGIIIGASSLSSKATRVQIMCRTCRHVRYINIQGGFSGITLPRRCEAEPVEGTKKECVLDPYVIIHEKSTFVNQQVLKLQETPDMVPVGDLPRHIMLSTDRYLTDKVVPGVRCSVVGIYSVYQSGSSKGNKSASVLRTPYIRVIGLEVDVEQNTKGSAVFTEEEEEEFLALSRKPDLYEVFANSIAPSIYGNKDIKKSIVCLLMGGSKRILPDGTRLRGDINVLLLGDPGTAKSQLLKFVEKVAPIAVYTSGKGSSAAGLTASVQRDQSTRDFYLEGGAMVLADGGVVCIDEFDKMRDEDRVAIHEAMEQQTISIAKAGITTILNSRTSVLAAANPLFGRYDDMKTPGENIDFQSTILSRFDMIYIVKDEHNTARDTTVAKHVMNIQMNKNTDQTNNVQGDIPIQKMKRYISYCRSKCAPRLSQEAAEKLSSYFVGIRKEVKSIEASQKERSSIPITIRQLEAIVRISESLAKLVLSPVVREEHVDEAVRLFFASTMNAVNQGSEGREELVKDVSKVEDELRQRLPVGWRVSYSSLIKEFIHQKGYSDAALRAALAIMERRNTIQFQKQRSVIVRSGP